ncbi:hypothetical protein [Sphingobacterium faecium]|uniref:hypothetical protein n=1 Tax=Sphingobacterium faecium TaxID=34087 RepID=UPI0024692905|nr:hypothetical protein [Sphingobacterium faecium]MDH5825827.1 hypothetical protein [Sphingobacterium faecium]
MPWFLFTPPIEGVKDPGEQDQYIIYEGEGPPIQEGTLIQSNVFAIYSTQDGLYPVITDELIKEMYNAITLKKDTENILLLHKKNSIKEFLKNF